MCMVERGGVRVNNHDEDIRTVHARQGQLRSRDTDRAYCLSRDCGFGFPVTEEMCNTLMVGTASGHYMAMIEVYES